MSKFVIALLVSLGLATWLFNKLQRSSGNNTEASLKGAGFIAIIGFIIIYVVLGMIS
jgi:hypothetical protein